MGSGIAEFLSALKGGGASPNRFEIAIDFPAGTGSGETTRQTTFLAQASSLPSSNLGTKEVFYRGRPLKLPGDRTFEDWDVTFYNDVDFGLRNAFEAWHDKMNKYSSNTGVINPSEVLSTLTAYQLDSENKRIKTYTMKLGWPSVVGQIELAQDSNNIVELFTVTFVYNDIDNGQSS